MDTERFPMPVSPDAVPFVTGFAIEISLWKKEDSGGGDISAEQKARNKTEKFACNSLRLALVC